MAETKPTTKQRYHFLDTLRGIAVLGMIFIHVSYDLPGMLQLHPSYLDSTWYAIFEQGVRIIFIGLSGYCAHMGKHPIRRGITVSLAGILVTLVTVITKTEPPIIFGVLTLIGASMILSAPFKKIINKKNGAAAGIIFLLLFLVTLHIFDGYLGFYNHPLWYYPEVLYSANHPSLTLITAFFGFPGRRFASSDYFPLIPWFFLFLSTFSFHAAFGEAIGKSKLMKLRIEPVSFLGRQALIVYLLHQPLIMGILTIISYIRR